MTVSKATRSRTSAVYAWSASSVAGFVLLLYAVRSDWSALCASFFLVLAYWSTYQLGRISEAIEREREGR